MKIFFDAFAKRLRFAFDANYCTLSDDPRLNLVEFHDPLHIAFFIGYP